MPSYNSVYLDAENRCWANINYYFGYRDVWICIDQPTADFTTLFPAGTPPKETAQTTTDTSTTQKRIVPKQNMTVVLLTVILVLAVVLITAGLLLKLKRKK